MLRNVLAFGAVALILGACSSRSSLGSGDDNLNGGKGGSGATGGGSTGGGGGSGNAGGGSWDPCSGAPCGAECKLCDPKDPNCVEDASLKFCGADGKCGGAYPDCGPVQTCTTDKECPAIGAPCQACPDGSAACPWSKCEKGQCVSGFDSCQGQECKLDEDCPAILAPCQQCPDGKFACPYSSCENGKCVGGFEGCAGYDPCAGKNCGEPCKVCPPDDPKCVEDAVLKVCDEKGACAPSIPVCDPNPGQCKLDSDCPAIEICKPCPGGACAVMACTNGACGWECPLPTSPECKLDSDCPAIEACKQCPGGACADMHCLNGSCELVCGL